MLRATIALLVAVAVLGCQTPERLEFVDDIDPPRPPTILGVRSDGERLIISFVQGEIPNLWISGISAEVLSGEVYVRAISTEKPVQTTEFSIDLSARRFPRDWRKRLYWITAYDVATDMQTGIGRRTGIVRRKLEVEDREREPNQALQTTPMTRSGTEKTIEFGDPQRGV